MEGAKKKGRSRTACQTQRTLQTEALRLSQHRLLPEQKKRRLLLSGSCLRCRRKIGLLMSPHAFLTFAVESLEEGVALRAMLHCTLLPQLSTCAARGAETDEGAL